LFLSWEDSEGKFMLLQPKNWVQFQHYKDRCPPWIKLHRDLLNNRDFMRLPIASKALAPMLWLLASESKNGVFDGSLDELVFRLHITEKEYKDGIKPLIDKGFFIVDSNVLAISKHTAIPETEGETEGEGEIETELFVETDKSVVNPKRISCPTEELLNLYHEECKSLPRVLMLNNTRRKHLVSRWRDVDAEDDLKSKDEGIEIFRQIFRQVHKSDFLSGRLQNRNGRVWKASFDWLMMPTNFLKVVEGQYDNGRK
jgi:hypothetical protein